MTNNDEVKFEVKHHALLFGLIARSAIKEFGQQGKEAITKGVIQYGEERGQRKAQTVRENNEDLNLINYFAYKEWEVKAGSSSSEFQLTESDLNLKVYRCPWYKTWKENNLVKYAYLYCQNIDKAILKGYNERLKLELDAEQGSGARYCNFYFKEEEIAAQDLDLIAEKREQVMEEAVKDWLYHTAHLYHTLQRVIASELETAGKKIMEKAETDFAAYCGQPRLQKIKKYSREETFDLK